MKLSVIIPAYNEADSLPETLSTLFNELSQARIDHELVVVDDNSQDNTHEVVDTLSSKIPTIVYRFNPPPQNGFGYAVRKGLNNFSGDCCAIFMADMSDSPQDLVRFYRTMLKEDVDCVFGSRFMKGSEVKDYPKLKLLINRIANYMIRAIFRIKYNDCTNAFKLYKKETIDGLRPFLSPHFNLTLELPLKSIVRGYSYAVVPNSWTNRKFGNSKLKIREMGSRYFFILLYCLIEKYFSKGDFRKKWDG